MDVPTIAHYVHYLVPLSILLMPFLPNSILLYVFPYPIIYYLIWFFCDGCPLTRFTKQHSSHLKDNDNFTKHMFAHVGIHLSEYKTRLLINIIVLLSVIVSAYKLILSPRDSY